MQVCGSKHSSPVKTSYTCALHLCTKRARIFLLSISRARRGSLEKCAAPNVCLSLSLFPFFSLLNSTLSLFPLTPAKACMQCACTLPDVVGRKQISEGDACGNVSQLISCWRNMVVIKRAFLLYGAYTSRPLGSCNHRVAENCGWRISHPDVPLGEFCGYSYQTIATFCTYTRTYSTRLT